MSSLTIITVLKNPGRELVITWTKLQTLQLNKSSTIKWLIIDSSDSPCLINPIPGIEITHLFETDTGIYNAMNKALKYIDTEFYIFINSGDFILQKLISTLTNNSKNVVTCYGSKWHNADLSESKTYRRKIRPSLGLLPNHQGMVFPLTFRQYIYDESFPIAADQDLKLRLYFQGLLKISETIGVSSLNGGKSQRIGSRFDVASRSQETFRVMRKHFGLVYSVIVTILYFTIYVRKWVIKR